MENNEILDNLYGIRSALSLISQIKTKTEHNNDSNSNKAKKEINDIEKEIVKYNGLIEKGNYQIKKQNDYVSQCKDELSSAQRRSSSQPDKWGGPSSSFGKVYASFIIPTVEDAIHIIFGPVLSAILGIALVVYLFNGPLHEQAQSIPLIVLLGVPFYILSMVAAAAVLSYAVFPLIYSFFYCFIIRPIKEASYRKRAKKENKAIREAAFTAIPELEKRYEDAVKARDDLKKEINAEKNENKRKINECQSSISAIESRNRNYITVSNDTLKQLSKSIYNAAVEKYGSTLDTRDWKYLDYIIYVFETRRADTIKEALAALDKYLQTQEIVAVIKRASDEVAYYISTYSKRIEKSITNSSSQICDAVYNSAIATIKSNAIVSDSIYDLSDNVSSLQSSMCNMVTIQNMTNALLEKSNESSERLLADYEYTQGSRQTR